MVQQSPFMEIVKIESVYGSRPVIKIVQSTSIEPDVALFLG
jgi:hypothetical protein